MVAQLTGSFPERIALVGCQPEELEDYGGSLRSRTKQALEEALDIALGHLREWGACPVQRSSPVGLDHVVTVPNLEMAAYETGRPSADQACRIGDDRFMPR